MAGPSSVHTPTLFEDKLCEQFADKSPDDIDLLDVSRKVAGFSPHSVGVCLGLGKDEIKEVLREYGSMPRCDKSHQLLALWKRKNGTSNTTWAKLVECLERLQEDRGLTEGIKAYLQNKVPPHIRNGKPSIIT